MNVKSLLAAVCGLTLLGVAPAVHASDALALKFVTHAAFFSAESKQPEVIDPEAFVTDPAKAAAVGPQGIKHVAGYRPARVDKDAKSTPVNTAEGRPLGLIGLVSRSLFVRWRGGALHGGKTLKAAMGLLLGAGIVSGLDRQAEAWLVAATPDWLTPLTTRF